MIEQPPSRMSKLIIAVRWEYRAAFRPPFLVPSALVTNAVLMTVVWFMLPPSIHGLVFSLHGPLAFPVILASWMLGDTPSTNVVGWDGDRILAALENRAAFRRWLAARCFVLASLVGFPAGIIAIGIGVVIGGSPLKVLAACVVIVILPFGILPVTSCLGLLFPYRPQSLRWRWEHRMNGRGLIRWLALVCAPFVVVPAVGAWVVLPSILVTRLVYGAPERILHPTAFVVLALIVVAMALITAAGGLRCAELLRIKRGNRLIRRFRDAEMG